LHITSCISLCKINIIIYLSYKYFFIVYLIFLVYLSVFRPRGIPAPTSKLSLRAPAQMGRRETEHKEGENRGFVLSCAQGGCACSRGLQASARERERERACLSARPPARPPPRTRALDLPFIDVRRGPRCTMGGVAIC
jgi:hypothetical protein